MLANRRPHISIRYALPLLFALLIMVTAAIIGILAFSSGSSVVSDLATQLSGEITARIEQHTQTYVNTPHLILDANAAAVNAGEIDLDDLPELADLFWHQIQVNDQISFISYGDQQGNFVAVESLQDGDVLRIRDASSAPLREEYQLNRRGERGDFILSQEYDPRERGWYKTAVSTNSSTWSNVYKVASRPVLAISPVQPVFNPDGEQLGVLASVLTLSQISDFLQDLTIGKTGEAFIMERTGNIVASSIEETPYRTNDQNELIRLPANDSRNALIRNTATELFARFGNTSGKIVNAEFQFTNEANDLHFVHATSLQDGRGLDWVIVVVIPASDFTGPITDRIRTTIQIAIAAVLLAVAIGIATARWIIRPILAVSEAAASVENEQFELAGLEPVEKRRDEMGRLARVFRRMVREIKAREEKLKQQVRKLKIEIDEVKSSKRVKEIVESDFFKSLEASSSDMRRRRQERRQRRQKN